MIQVEPVNHSLINKLIAISIAVILAIVFLIFNKCGNSAEIKIKPSYNLSDSLLKENKALKRHNEILKVIALQSKNKADSAIKTIPTAKIKWKDKIIEIEKRIPVIYLPAIDSLNKIKQVSDSTYEYAIKELKMSNTVQSKIIDNNTLQMYNDGILYGLRNDTIIALKKEVKVLKRKVIIAKLGGWLKSIGFGTIGYGAGKILP